jgi:hypothetical protein
VGEGNDSLSNETAPVGLGYSVLPIALPIEAYATMSPVIATTAHLVTICGRKRSVAAMSRRCCGERDNCRAKWYGVRNSAKSHDANESNKLNNPIAREK